MKSVDQAAACALFNAGDRCWKPTNFTVGMRVGPDPATGAKAAKSVGAPRLPLLPTRGTRGRLPKLAARRTNFAVQHSQRDDPHLLVRAARAYRRRKEGFGHPMRIDESKIDAAMLAVVRVKTQAAHGAALVRDGINGPATNRLQHRGPSDDCGIEFRPLRLTHEGAETRFRSNIVSLPAHYVVERTLSQVSACPAPAAKMSARAFLVRRPRGAACAGR